MCDVIRLKAKHHDIMLKKKKESHNTFRFFVLLDRLRKQHSRLKCEIQGFYTVNTQQYVNYSGPLPSNALGPSWFSVRNLE